MSNGDKLTKLVPLTRVTPEMYAAVKKLARVHDKTMCAIVRAALAAYIQKEAGGDDTTSD